MYVDYKGKDPVYKRIHATLNKIQWIMDHKRPYPTKTDPANDKKSEFMDLFEELLKQKTR